MKNLSEISGQPQMQDTFNGWQQKIVLGKVIQAIVDSLVTEATIQFAFMGIVQPLSPRQISFKPEGLRAWTWLQIHVMSTWLAPSPVAEFTSWDAGSGQTWDTPGQTYDATGANGMLAVWRNLNDNDKIFYKNCKYKILGRKDYSLNGFLEYHAVQDYVNE